MNAPVTRRALLGATAAVGACALPALAETETGIPVSDPDALWSILLDRRRAARAAWNATDAPLGEAMARAAAAYPPRPLALRPVFGDVLRGVADSQEDGGRERDADGRIRGFSTDGDVAVLRAAGPVMESSGWDDDGQPIRQPSPFGEARRWEIVAAHDAWEAACQRVQDEVGLTAAAAAEEATSEAYFAADDAVKEYQPRTVAGLVEKATWVAERLSTCEGATSLGLTFARQVAAFGGVAT